MKTGGRNIEKGQVLNPIGGNAHNPEVRMVRKLTNEQVIELSTIILEGNPQKLRDVMNDKSSTVLQVAIASALNKAIIRGDMAAVNALLDRILGKVKDRVDISGDVGIKVSITDYTSKKDGD